MGVTYKLRDEVVQFIIRQRQSNPLFSCRQLAESASQQFGLNLSKSSVHDVLKESGVITPRGRKPKDKFQIPQEKKKQIQSNLSQIKLISPPSQLTLIPDIASAKPELVEAPLVPLGDLIVILSEAKDLNASLDSSPSGLRMTNNMQISPEYEGAGKIFLKAALWDLGIFSQEEHIKETDWGYYLTYCKGIKVDLENDQNFFIDLPLPLERCIREAADGLINNIKPLIIYKVSDETLFKASMEAQTGFKINTVSIVDGNNHVLLNFNDIMEFIRDNKKENMVFVESKLRNPLERAKALFFPQAMDTVIESIFNLKGFDSANKDNYSVTLINQSSYDNKATLQEAVEKLNGMFLRDEQGRLVNIKIS